MTPLFLSVLGILTLYAVYIAARVARMDAAPASFLNGGNALPGWASMFLLPGLLIAALGVDRHLDFITRYGLQASHVALGLVLASMAALLAWNRVWYAARIAGFATPAEALGRFYGSVTLRVVVLGLALLFALPYAANILSFAAELIERATQGAIPRIAGVWLMALSLAVPAIIGGWRATVLTLAMMSVLLGVLLPGTAIFAEIVLPGPGFPASPIPVADGVFWDRLPGVIQYVGGIGKAVPPGGLFTTVAVGSGALALVGAVVSPAALYLGQTGRQGATLGVSVVWLTGGLAAGLLLLCGPLLATRLTDGVVELAEALYAAEPIAGVGTVLLMLVGALLSIGFFVTGGALIVTREVVLTYLLPNLSQKGQRFAARVSLGFGFFLVGFMAAFLPLVSAVLASVALPLSVQLIPALLGLTFLRWISRGAVLAGLIIGALIVLFTEPPGLILFEALFVDLPWGRWPLTIHSAAWGLFFNLVIVLLSATVTLGASDRFERDRLHDAMDQATGVKIGRRGLLWALTLLWGFLAYGPGAVLGNTFFSDPIFSPIPATLGIPSLWVWQLLFWLIGGVLVWWIAYRIGLGTMSEAAIKPIALGRAPARRTPDWLAEGLRRVRGKDALPPSTAPSNSNIRLISPGGPPSKRRSSGSGS